MDYRESSRIASVYTKEFGRISVLIKGARLQKSLAGMKTDVFNHLQIVLYKKYNRELHLLTQAELINHFPNIKTELDKLKYGGAVLELIQALTVEEANHRLFKGLVKIINLFESSDEHPGSLLIKFILFLLKETGYGIQPGHCSDCQGLIIEGDGMLFSFERGIVCHECGKNYAGENLFPKELINLIHGLRRRKSSAVNNIKEIERILCFLENYLRYHINEFKGIRSIHLY